jgi:hypothetical protein
MRYPAKRAIRRGRIVAVARFLGGLPASSSAARDSRQRSGIAKTLLWLASFMTHDLGSRDVPPSPA